MKEASCQLQVGVGNRSMGIGCCDEVGEDIMGPLESPDQGLCWLCSLSGTQFRVTKPDSASTLPRSIMVAFGAWVEWNYFSNASRTVTDISLHPTKVL